MTRPPTIVRLLLALVVIALSIAALSACAPKAKPEADTQATAPTETPAPAPEPEKPKMRPGQDWALVPDPDGVFASAHIYDFVEGGPGLIAAGRVDDASGESKVCVWTSPDGVKWQRTDLEAIPIWSTNRGGIPDPYAFGDVRLATDGTRFLLKGDDMLWTSPDGVSWTPQRGVIDGEKALHKKLGRYGKNVRYFGLFDVAVGPQAYAAVGTGEGKPDRRYTSLWGYAATWSSPDGAAWSIAPFSVAKFGRQADLGADAVIATDDGFLSVGKFITPSGKTLVDAGIWKANAEGKEWRRVDGGPDAHSKDSEVMWDVTKGGPGFVSVGSLSKRGSAKVVPAVWTSTDGETWTRVPAGDAFQDGAAIFRIASGSAGLVGVGWQSGEYMKRPAGLWRSSDGVTWAVEPFPVGVESDSEGRTPVVCALSACSRGFIASGYSATGGHIWVSGDFDVPYTQAGPGEASGSGAASATP